MKKLKQDSDKLLSMQASEKDQLIKTLQQQMMEVGTKVKLLEDEA